MLIEQEQSRKLQTATSYWGASRAWRGQPSEIKTTGDLIEAARDTAGEANRLPWPKLENHAAKLLQDVIQARRPKKLGKLSKANVITLQASMAVNTSTPTIVTTSVSASTTSLTAVG